MSELLTGAPEPEKMSAREVLAAVVHQFGGAVDVTLGHLTVARSGLRLIARWSADRRVLHLSVPHRIHIVE